MSGNKWDNLHALPGVNNLSIDFQKEGLDNLNNAATVQLSNAIPYEDITDQDIPKNKNKISQVEAEIAAGLLHKLTTLSNNTSEALKKPDAPENNIALLKYLNEAIDLVHEARDHANEKLPKSKNLNSLLKKIDTFYLQQLNYISEAIDPKIYLLEIPKEEYNKIMKNSERFYYEGNATAAAKFGLGAAGAALSLGAAGSVLTTTMIFAPTAASLSSAKVDSDGIIKLLELSAKGAEKSIDLMRQGASRFGYCCMQDLPPEWIAGAVQFATFSKQIDTDPDENRPIEIKEILPVITKKNDNYINAQKIAENKAAPASKETVRVYLLDDKAYAEIFKKGTDYNLKAGSVGHYKRGVVFFHNPKDAMRFAQRHANGKSYDVHGGWLINGIWSGALRALMQATENAKKQHLADKAKAASEPTDNKQRRAPSG